MKKGLLIICLALLSANAIAADKPPKQIGEFKKWSAYVMQQNGQKVCYVIGLPDKMEGKYSSRGDTYIMITHRPPGSMNVVSIHPGYDYPDDYKAKVKIDKKTYEFSSNKDTPNTAWLADDNDSKVAAALGSGSKMVVNGESKKGTKTVDTYVLSGASLALKAAKNACKSK